MTRYMVGIAVLCLWVCPAQAKENLVITGEVFDLEGTKKLFNYSRFTTKNGTHLTKRNEFRDLSGKLIVNERAEIVDGRLANMVVEQPQTMESGSIVVKDKKVFFTYKNAKGEVEKSTESLPDNFNVHMTIIPYMQKHWKELRAGKSVRVRMGVWQRAETVGFKIWQDSEKIVDGKKQFVLVMKPTNFLIRAIVDPIYFTFKAGGIFLVSVKGRTTPKIKNGESWDDLDALIRFKNLLLTL